jgi:hypothetical protein
VLTQTMKKIETQAGDLQRPVRNRTRSVGKRVIAIAAASRHKGPEGGAKRKKQYRELLRWTRQILNDASRVVAEVEQVPAKKKKKLRGMSERLTVMADRVRQVVRQAKARVFDGITQLPGKIVSLFEPHTEIIRKGKASKPTEFGKLVQVQETENQIITHYDVFDQRPSDRDLLPGAGKPTSECWAGCQIWRRGGLRLLLAGARAGGGREGREMGSGAESQHEERRTEKEGTQPMVQEGAAMGGVGSDGRHADQYGQCSGNPHINPKSRGPLRTGATPQKRQLSLADKPAETVRAVQKCLFCDGK